MRTADREQGFTLVEVIAAMGILVLCMSSILGLLSFGLALHRTNTRKAEAGLSVEAVLQDLRGRDIAVEPGKAPAEPREIKEQPVPGHKLFTYSAKFSENPKLLGEYLVDLEISWKEKGRRRSQQFRTIWLQEASFPSRVRALPFSK